MKVMISLPMNGRKDNEVKKRIEYLKKEFAKLHIDVVNSFITDKVKDSLHPNVYYLGRTLMKHMHNVDAVYFDTGWEEARGCRIERQICVEYKIKVLDSDFFEPLYSASPLTLASNVHHAGDVLHISYKEGSNG